MKPNAYAKKLTEMRSYLIAAEKQEIILHVVEIMDRAFAVAQHEEFGHGKKRHERLRKRLADVFERYELAKRLNDLDFADGKLEEAFKRIMEGR